MKPVLPHQSGGKITRWSDGGVTITQGDQWPREVTIRPNEFHRLADAAGVVNVGVTRWEDGRQVAAGLNLTVPEAAELVAALCRFITEEASR